MSQRLEDGGGGEQGKASGPQPESLVPPSPRGLLPQDKQCPLAITGQHRPSLLPPVPTRLSSGAWGRALACMSIMGQDLSQSVQPAAAWLGQGDLLTPKPSEPHLFSPPHPPSLGEP